MLNKNDKTTQIRCKECNNIIYLDTRLDELYCKHCGLVITTNYNQPYHKTHTIRS